MAKSTIKVVLAIQLFLSVNCLAPPHPNFVDEYNSKYRRSLRSKGNARRKSDFCPNVTTDYCVTSVLGRTTDATHTLIQRFGSLNVLVLLVRFTDHVDRVLPSNESIIDLWISKNITDDLQSGSIQRYFLENSYGKLKIEASVTDWITTDNTELHYSFGNAGMSSKVALAVYPILEQLDRENYDFSRHDSDGDKMIDSLVFLHSGYSAEVGGADCTNERDFKSRIWSHVGTHLSTWQSKDGYGFDSYMVASALRGVCDSQVASIGVISHEFIHTWGIPDLYDPGWVGKGTGNYDIMSNPFGMDGTQIYPFYMSPWTRIKSGFSVPIEIEFDGFYSIESSATSDQIYIIRTHFAEGEYLLIENRQAIGYDVQMLGSGLLIWHIDEKAGLQNFPGYPGQDNWPQNGNHYQVALLQADGSYDLEKGNNGGDEMDFFTQDLELTPSSEAYPNSNSYRDGEIFMTGIRIYGISQSSKIMDFRVSGVADRPGPPTSAPSVDPSSSPTSPTFPPTQFPSFSPSTKPSYEPTLSPSASPSWNPSAQPTLYPTLVISNLPTILPSKSPTVTLSQDPSMAPSSFPSIVKNSTIKSIDTPSNILQVESTSEPYQPSTVYPTEYPSTVLITTDFSGMTNASGLGNIFDRVNPLR